MVKCVGKQPGLAPHGNAKTKTEYVRTPHFVMVEMAELLKNKKPHVFDILNNKHDELSGPENLQQVYDKKSRGNKKNN